MTAAAPHRPIRNLLSSADYRRVWFVGGVIWTMRWLEVLAMSIYTFDLTGSAFAVALMTALRSLPMLLVSAYAGAIAERFDRRRLLIAAMIMLAISNAVLGLLALAGWIELWHIAIGAMLNGLYWAADMSVRRTVMAEIAGIDRLGAAMTVDSATNNLTRFLGPIAGGLIYQFLGLHGSFLVVGLFYALAAIAALPISHRSELSGAPPMRMLDSILEGLRHALADRAIAGTLALTFVLNLLVFPYNALIPVIGRDEMGLEPFPIGVLMAAEGVGAVIGAIFIAPLIRPAGYMRLYVVGSSTIAISVLLFALSHSFESALIVLTLSGLGVAGFASMQSTLVYSLAPPGLRPRIMGALSTCIGAMPLGILYIGFLAAQLGTRGALLALAIQGVVAVALVLIIWPELRR